MHTKYKVRTTGVRYENSDRHLVICPQRRFYVGCLKEVRGTEVGSDVYTQVTAVYLTWYANALGLKERPITSQLPVSMVRRKFVSECVAINLY
jgi:hypothetical protein